MSQDKPSRLDVYLQEYDKLKDEQTSRIGFRDNLLYVTLITIGGVLSFAFANDSGYKLYALLTVPWICVVLGWNYVVNDEKISSISMYLEEYLAVQIQDDISASPLSSQQHLNSVFLGWEFFRKNKNVERRKRRKIEQLVVDEMVFFIPGLTSLVAVLKLIPSLPIPIYVLCSIELAMVLVLGIEIIIYSGLGKNS